MKRRRQPISPIAAEVEVLENRALLSVGSHTSLLKQLTPANEVVTNANTSPSNGDLNPYGLAFVPQNFVKGGPLKPGDLLVSNFNNGLPNNQQGTGTTIVDIHPNGSQSLFFQGTNLGLTTALGVLSRGYVIVGNLPTTYPPPSGNPVVHQGSLLILNKFGHVVETLTSAQLLDGPWDLAVNDQGATAQIFVSNVLNGVVTRINLDVPWNGSAPTVESETRIGSGYEHRTDPAALEVGPTGLAYDAKTDTLFVASTEDNAVYAIHDASDATHSNGKGMLIYQDQKHLHGPLGLVLLPDGNLIASEGDAINPPDSNHFSELTEFTQSGKFIAQYQVDSVIGSAFGVAIEQVNDRILFAAVDDNTSTVSIWSVPN
jgi:hypothetical protein